MSEDREIMLKNIFSRLIKGTPQPKTSVEMPQTHLPITIVSGLPRSGTSLMMRMLEGGGIPPQTDHQRTADDDNPGGYYEFERVKQVEKGDTAWLAEMPGKAVKVISILLRHLPVDYQYRVILMERDLEEVLASQRKMLVNREANVNAVDDAQMIALFTQHLQEIRQWLAEQDNFVVLYVSYGELLTNPEPIVEAINRFFDNCLDSAAMLAVIDPTLYRNRQE